MANGDHHHKGGPKRDGTHGKAVRDGSTSGTKRIDKVEPPRKPAKKSSGKK